VCSVCRLQARAEHKPRRMLPDPAKCTRRVSAACKPSVEATTSTTAHRSHHCSTDTTTTTSTSQHGTADSSHRRSTDTAHMPLMIERHVFIPSVRNAEDDRQHCNLKLTTANGYKPYQLAAGESDNRPDRQDAQLLQRDRATLCVS